MGAYRRPWAASAAAASAFLLMIAAPVLAQPGSARAEVEQRLAGSNGRDWIRSREVLFMGDGKCQSGERWRFSRDGTLKIRTCTQQQWRVSAHRWKLEPDGALDYKLLITPAVTED